MLMAKTLRILTVFSYALLWLSNVLGQNESQATEEHNPFGSVLALSRKFDPENSLLPDDPAQNTDASLKIQSGTRTEEKSVLPSDRIISRKLVKKKKGISPQMLSAITQENNISLLHPDPIASKQVLQKILSRFRVKKSIASTQWFSKNQEFLQRSTALQPRTIENEVKKTQPTESPTGNIFIRSDKEKEESSRTLYWNLFQKNLKTKFHKHPRNQRKMNLF